MNFTIDTIRNGDTSKPHLQYIRRLGSSYYGTYNNQWRDMEGFKTSFTTPYGVKFSSVDGDVMYYMTDKSSYDDFGSSGTTLVGRVEKSLLETKIEVLRGKKRASLWGARFFIPSAGHKSTKYGMIDKNKYKPSFQAAKPDGNPEKLLQSECDSEGTGHLTTMT